MTDDMIKKLGENDGVMDINFYTAFLSNEVALRNKEIEALLKSKNISSEDSAAMPIMEQ